MEQTENVKERVSETVGDLKDTLREHLPPETARHASAQNVGDTERAISLAGAALLTAAGLGRGGLPGLLMIGGGLMLLVRGASGHCSLYSALEVNTNRAR